MPSAAAPSLVAPGWFTSPGHSLTFGPEVAHFCDSIGFHPDPEQRLILDELFGYRGLKPAAREVGICAPRQNIKTGVLKMAALGWLYVSELRLVIWSAHEFNTAQEAFRDLCMLIEDNPDLDAEVKWTSRGKTGISRGHGEQAIELRGDRRLIFKARTKSGGRGLTGDRVVLDEAMYLSADMMAALKPTLRARPDAQLVYAGSAGLLQSDVWRSVRDRGRAGDPALSWIEYGDRRAWEGCEDSECSHLYGVAGCALDDPERYWATNTALHSGRIDIETLMDDRRALPPIKQATESLGWWEDPPEADDAHDNGMPGWAMAVTERGATAPFTVGVAVSADSRSGAIAVYGSGVVEVVDYRKGAGIGWLGARAREVAGKWGAPIVALAGSPTKQLAADLGDGTVWVPAAEWPAACMGFARRINEGTLAHRGQAVLDIAAGNAVRAHAGDVWRWSLSKSVEVRGTDVSPLLAAVLAVHVGGSGPAYDPLANFMPNL